MLARFERHPPDARNLNLVGYPYQSHKFRSLVQRNIYSFTDKHFHPHIIRSIWATEWIKKIHIELYTDAVMINNNLETFIVNYVHLREYNVAEKEQRIIEER